MKKLFLFSLMTLVAMASAVAADNNEFYVRGHVVNATNGDHLPFATVQVVGTMEGTAADATGHFTLNGMQPGKQQLKVSLVGYAPQTQDVTVATGSGSVDLTFKLEEDALAMEQVVVSGNRTQTTRMNSPTVVSVMTSELFEEVGAPTLADGLTYQSGVRVDNNCQNCGFTQVRINGLEGPYSQILINSRPLFTALTGVYGLEAMPASMIDRVEVVRGGGSALFGASAIGGTINVITKTPTANSGEIAHSLTSMGDGALDNNTTANVSLVSKNNRAGMILYAQNRKRDAWDANDDGFTEIAELETKVMGLSTFFKINDYSKLTLNYDGIYDNRRGGNLLDEPFQYAEIAESASHTINSGGINYDLISRNYDRKFNIYTSAMHTKRDSYYGGADYYYDDKGNVDYTQLLDSYGGQGLTTDLTVVTGSQFTQTFNNFPIMPFELVAGLEHTYNALEDTLYDEAEFVGNREATTNQDINIYSGYAQGEWKNDKFGLLAGVRADKHSLVDNVIFSPRVNLRYNPTKGVNLRATYSTGFRAPQIFDEDLHIEIVNQTPTKITNDDDLTEEKSRSFTISADIYKNFGKLSTNFLVEGFHTTLLDAFSLEDRTTEDDDINLWVRTNSSGAKVFGGTFEARAAVANVFDFQAGMTIQRSEYDEAQDYGNEDEDQVLMEKTILRSPDMYGYMTLNVPFCKRWNLGVTGTFTGKMLVLHEAQEIVYDGDIIEGNEIIESNPFADINLKLSYDFTVAKSVRMSVYATVQNLFNSYQDDFDSGVTRDPGYVYGPMNPRRWGGGVKLMF
ncbi:MAG: TonB-dependent receptor [Rikenellaceae bacterium]